MNIASSTNVTCAGNNNGNATVIVSGGWPAYTYLWSPSNETTASAQSLSAGNNTIVVQDARGCTRTASILITQPDPLQGVIASSSDVSCYGGNNGSASVMASGGTPSYSYLWLETGDVTPTVSSLSAGTYNVSIRDEKNCPVSASVTILQPALLQSSVVSFQSVNCNGASNGSATVTATGGSPGYFYSWNPSGGTKCKCIRAWTCILQCDCHRSEGLYIYINNTDHPAGTFNFLSGSRYEFQMFRKL